LQAVSAFLAALSFLVWDFPDICPRRRGTVSSLVCPSLNLRLFFIFLGGLFPFTSFCRFLALYFFFPFSGSLFAHFSTFFLFFQHCPLKAQFCHHAVDVPPSSYAPGPFFHPGVSSQSFFLGLLPIVGWSRCTFNVSFFFPVFFSPRLAEISFPLGREFSCFHRVPHLVCPPPGLQRCVAA